MQGIRVHWTMCSLQKSAYAFRYGCFLQYFISMQDVQTNALGWFRRIKLKRYLNCDGINSKRMLFHTVLIHKLTIKPRSLNWETFCLRVQIHRLLVPLFMWVDFPSRPDVADDPKVRTYRYRRNQIMNHLLTECKEFYI